MKRYKLIPPVDELLKLDGIAACQDQLPPAFILERLRESVQELREALKKGMALASREEASSWIVEAFERRIRQMRGGSLQPVINATGVVLHTNLGRSPMPDAALQAINRLAAGYCNLEYDLEAGRRGSRYQHVEALLCRLTGAEAALVVNNNAAAVLLALTTLARGREVIVSRGQLIEIGGAFRIPDVMAASGASLVEVGTTNRTYISDFTRALNENTALLFSAHTSNYRVVGFTAETSLKELVELGQKNRIPVMQDLGSGILLDMSAWGLNDEPTVQEALASGVDVLSFSGDKLLGGPQAGILLGRRENIEAFKNNQLTRALRVDKLTIAALEASLLQYEQGDPVSSIPVLGMLAASQDILRERAQNLKAALDEQRPGLELKLLQVGDMVGGGAYPDKELQGWAVALALPDTGLEELNRRLRSGSPAVVARRQDERLLFSARTIGDDEIEALAEAVAAALKAVQTRE